MEFATVKAAVSVAETPDVRSGERARRGGAEGRVTSLMAGRRCLVIKAVEKGNESLKVQMHEGSGKAGGINPEQIVHINKPAVHVKG